jgi:DNA-binding PadR family transcriptional regulator
MGARGARGRSLAPISSPVYWGVLGLVIERPSYAYELARRFERTYAGSLSISSVSHVYTALAALRDRGFVDTPQDSDTVSRSRRRWEATPLGVSEHAQWLVSAVHDERCRQRVLIAQIGAIAHMPEQALATLDAYEHACVREIAAAPPPGADEGAGTTRLVARLAAEETRLTLASRLRWVQYARAQLQALITPRPEAE